ncbi:acyl-CoA dehydrogenase family protein [Gordonia rubripertincta]|uniref:Acyl-CoA/acyl-ACP dehydrogenase n=1 Tax=Gordonia rubripertincta TaxID=36822 RepID=A0ABT4MZ54_GORRU|nr:acyl-CoA dehydrogenase family protein [Gordonia rubripertincta]MCZ4551995.1 acyl-CoA/acyl-ACP dehydrogenase [Gordonia rubripertincta]
MDFHRSEQTADLAGLTRDIVKKLVTTDRLVQLEQTGDAPGAKQGAFDPTLWSQLAASGLLGLEVTEDDGGAGLSVLENVAVAEELGRALALVPFGPVAFAAAPAIAEFAAQSLTTQWLGPVISGDKVITVGLDEDLNDDPLAPVTTATADGEGWVLSGAKINVPFGEFSDAVIVNAQGPQGVLALLVGTSEAGVAITPALSTGQGPSALVEFDSVRVPAEQVLGSDDGEKVVRFLRDRMTLALCAEQTGILERALELTADYGREREQFGRAIGSFQAVAQRLADAYIDVRGLKLTTLQAAWLLSEQLDATTELATAKFWAADAGHRVAHTAVHVHGGVGIDVDHPVHRYFLRAKQNEFNLGSAPTQLRRIGAALAAEPA